MNMKIFILWLLCVVICISTITAAAQNNTSVSSNITKKEIGAQSNKLGVDLLHELRKTEQDKNVVISPVSISIALSMLMNGADQQTQQQMATLLGIDVTALGAVNKAVSDFLDSAIQADPAVELEIANAIFSQKGKRINAAFMKITQKEFQGRIKELDFNADKEAVTKINKWVEQKTNGKIHTIFATLDPNTVMVLANAVYFKSAWQYPFNVKLTTDREFTGGDKKKKVPTMNQEGHFQYQQTKDFQAVSLSYGEDDRFCMDIYLPKSGVTLDTMLKGLMATALKKNARNFAKASGELFLPRFKVEWVQNLRQSLIALGMKDAFNNGKADFSKLFDDTGNYALDMVKHKTVIEVNEEGTKAAAVTASVAVFASTDPTPRFVMDVNRPFFFVIRDKDTGAIFFMGTILDPIKYDILDPIKYDEGELDEGEIDDLLREDRDLKKDFE